MFPRMFPIRQFWNLSQKFDWTMSALTVDVSSSWQAPNVLHAMIWPISGAGRLDRKQWGSAVKMPNNASDWGTPTTLERRPGHIEYANLAHLWQARAPHQPWLILHDCAIVCGARDTTVKQNWNRSHGHLLSPILPPVALSHEESAPPTSICWSVFDQ